MDSFRMFPAILQRGHSVGLLEMLREMAAVAEARFPGDFLYGLAAFRRVMAYCRRILVWYSWGE